MLVAHHKIKVCNTEMKIPLNPKGQDKTEKNEPLHYTDLYDYDSYEGVRRISQELRKHYEPEPDVVRAIDMVDEFRKHGIPIPWEEPPAGEQDYDPTEGLDRFPWAVALDEDLKQL
jgi:hypothetical protein